MAGEIFVQTNSKIAELILEKLPAECWNDPEYVFLDICSKNGMLLKLAFDKLMNGLADAFPDEKERGRHILGRQLAAISPNQESLDATIKEVFGEEFAGRAFYRKSVHHWDDKGFCRECGIKKAAYAGATEFNAYPGLHRSVEMSRWLRTVMPSGEKLAIVSDPVFFIPFMKSTKSYPIYDKYFSTAAAMKPAHIAMNLAARWMVNAGKKASEFRNVLANSYRIEDFDWIDNGSPLFYKNVSLQDGICIVHWNSKWNSKNCRFTTHGADGKAVTEIRRLSRGGFVYNSSVKMELGFIVDKFLKSGKEKTLSDLYLAPKTFGIPTNFSDYSETPFENAVKVHLGGSRSGWIRKDQIVRNKQLVDKITVAIYESYSNGNAKGFICGQGECTSATAANFGPFRNYEEGKTFLHNITTSKYAKAFIELCKNTQHACIDVYRLFPAKGITKDSYDENIKTCLGIPDSLHQAIIG